MKLNIKYNISELVYCPISFFERINFLVVMTVLMFSIAGSSLFATTVVEPWYTPPKQGTDSTYDGATFEKIKTLIVSVNWSNISLKEALKDLTSKSQQADPDHLGIKFISNASSSIQKVNIVITDVPIDDVLAYLAQQTHLGMKIHKREVVFLPLRETAESGK